MFLNILIFILSVLFIAYVWLIYHYDHWKRKNIPGPTPKLLGGHLKIREGESLGVTFMNIYNQYKSQPLTGLFLVLKKALLVNDLDLVKNILIKDHQYFLGHGFTFEANAEPITQHLFNLEGDDWKKMRVKLTPTFTSSKMRMMYETMYHCSEEMIKYMNSFAENGKPVDFKEIVSKFGTDVIASCAFGLQSNSFKDEEAEFRKMGRKLLVLDPKRTLALIISLISPKLMDLSGIERIPKDVSKFFFKVVKETVEYREKNKIRRNDFLQLLIDMKNDDSNPDGSLSLAEITAQVFVFFIAGFETSSTTSSFALLELSRNKELMKQVVEEIDQAIDGDGGKITYETLSKMDLLTQVINETLRMYPSLPILIRRCTTDYPVPDSKVVIEKGTLIVIPVLGIHRDADIYPSPNKFMPERFSPENIKSRHACAHIPFGEGPRICIDIHLKFSNFKWDERALHIQYLPLGGSNLRKTLITRTFSMFIKHAEGSHTGSRFGMMQVRLGLAMTLRHFNVELITKVPEVVKLAGRSLALKTEDNMVMKLTKRKL